jgi:uncharacterized protein (TIGR00251 family)
LQDWCVDRKNRAKHHTVFFLQDQQLIALESHSDGVILPVRAQPGSRANELRGEQDGALKVCVTQVAEKGKANRAIRDLLCRKLDLRKSQVELIQGEMSQQKRYLIRGISIAELRSRLSDLP